MSITYHHSMTLLSLNWDHYLVSLPEEYCLGNVAAIVVELLGKSPVSDAQLELEGLWPGRRAPLWLADILPLK